MMWYFAENNERQGPVGLEELQELVTQGRVTRGTLVWQKGMAEWQPIEKTELQDFLEKYAPPPLPAVSPNFKSESLDSSNDDQPLVKIGRINTWFKAYWVTLAIVAPATLVVSSFMVGFTDAELVTYYSQELSLAIGLAFSSLISVAGMVFGYFVIFQCWEVIYTRRSRTTPAKAVGFTFIPLYGLYWQFIAIYGLAKEINQYARLHKVRNVKIQEPLALWYCITTCTYLIPGLNVITGVAGMVLWIILLNSFRKSIVSILETKLSRSGKIS